MMSRLELSVLLLLTFISTCDSQILYNFVSATYMVTEGDQVEIQIERTGTDTVLRSVVVVLENADSGDIIGTSQVATFQPPDLMSQVTFATVDDSLPELDEVFTLSLQSTASNVVIGNQSTAIITISANDDAAGIFSLESNERLIINEGETIQISILRTAGDFGNVRIYFELADTDMDITPSSGYVDFLQGERINFINITAVNDNIPENGELFSLILSSTNPSNISIVNRVRQIHIEKSDVPIHLSQERIFVAEGDTQTTIHLLVIRGRITLSGSAEIIGPIDSQISVTYTVTARSAGQDQDFTMEDGMIMFSSGELTKNISVLILPDNIPELDEEFHVTLTSVDGDGVLVTPNSTVVVISANDDQHGVLLFDPMENSISYLYEDQTLPRLTLTILRRAGTFGQIGVVYNVTGNEDVSADLMPFAGIITFDGGATSAVLTLDAVQDSIPEVSEAFTISLTAVTGGGRIDGEQQRTVIIQDSDMAHGVVQWKSGEHVLNTLSTLRFITWTVERGGGTIGDVAVTFTCSYSVAGVVVPGTLTRDRVYQVIIPDGQSTANISVDINNSSFLRVGGQFEVLFDEVKLITDYDYPSFNSPYKGTTRLDRLVVTSANANGEIGFSDLSTVYVTEPETGSNKVSIPISREGTSGTATIFWSLEGLAPSAINSSDVSSMSGSVTLLTGQSIAVIEVEILADNLSETEESMILTLDDVQPSDTQQLRINFIQITLTIYENDNPGGVFQLTQDSSAPIARIEGESFSISVERLGGNLVSRTIFYTMSSSGNAEFFGSSGILTFRPGENLKTITIIVTDDDIPEVDETYIFSIRDHGEPRALLGSSTAANVTILENDYPYGRIHFLADSRYSLFESKDGNVSTVRIPLVRSRGTFDTVIVSWRSQESDSSKDLTPVFGSVEFQPRQDTVFIEISSLADNLPEESEEFIIELMSASSGAELSSPNFTTISVIKNDVAVYFQEPSIVYVREDGTAHLTVKRTEASKPASVSYQTVNGTAGSLDYQQAIGEVRFGVGQHEAQIQIGIIDDAVPESQEFFYVQLFNPIGDIVVYNVTEATVFIEANDDANGVFKFGGPYDVEVQEGDRLALGVLRDRGAFDSVTLEWRITANGTSIEHGREFEEVQGYLTFADGQTGQNLELFVIADGIPEYSKEYVVELINVTGDISGEFQGGISPSQTSIRLTILTNDDPNGVIAFGPHSREMTVAEDHVDEMDNLTQATFNIVRSQGLSGDVQVLWEVYSNQVAGALPQVSNILFLSELKSQVYTLDGRDGSQSLAYNFTMEPESYALLEPNYQSDWVLGEFALSVWVKPAPGSNGYVVLKVSESGTQHYYSLRLAADTRGVPVTVSFSLVDRLTMQPMVAQALWRSSDVESSSQTGWQHLLINVAGETADFVFNGALSAQKTIPSARLDSAVGSGLMYIGSSAGGEDKYHGLLQALRIFSRKLSHAEIVETITSPSRLDLEPTSGVLHLSSGQTNSSITLRALQDVEAETNEVFSVKLITVNGGARISNANSLALLTVLKSDNANGLFGFDGPCEPLGDASEGVIITCVVRRERGDAGVVVVRWRIDQRQDNGTIAQNEEDFNSSSSEIVFEPGQLYEEIRLETVQDGVPELAEYFQVVLEAVFTSDGLLFSSDDSGASLDPRSTVANITVIENDLPNGLLQFSATQEEMVDNSVIPTATTQPEMRISEDIGVVQILLERAQGVIGAVDVEWRTEDGTARSTAVANPDYESAIGNVQFASRQRYSYINLTIVDDEVAEDDKYFLVHLVNPTGGATLGLGSTIKVIISYSDDAYGVVQFHQGSLITHVSEDDSQTTDVVLEIIRTSGLIGNTVVSWNILDDRDSDFVVDTGSAQIFDGQSQTRITLSVRHDTTPELDEVFSVLITNVSQGRLGTEDALTSTVTILANDDPYGVFIISESSRSVQTTEANIEVNITVTRAMGLVGVVAVGYQTVLPEGQSTYYPIGIERANFTDYSQSNGTVTFGEGQRSQTFLVSVRDDDIPEPDESFFVELTSAILVSGGQERDLATSPRIGDASATFARVIIETNDNANGILELSANRVSVSEGTTTPIVSVTRTAGSFGEVTVRFEVVPGNATASADYYYTSNNVILSDKETTKQVPIYVNDDSFPELSETFTVRLLPYITGGATLGDRSECVVTIEASDDPQGAFEFSSTSANVEEPSSGVQEVNIRVNRIGGTMGIVVVQWIALSEAGIEVDEDIDPSHGNIYFTSNQAAQDIIVEVKSDTVPEITERVVFNLTHASNGGRVGWSRLFSLNIRANDNPHGVVGFASEEFELFEEEASSVQNIAVTRSGGTFGDLMVYYSTSMIELIALAPDIIPTGSDYLWFFNEPVTGSANISGLTLDKSNQANPLQACAEFCLLESVCTSFEMNQSSLICTWFTELSDVLALQSTHVSMFFRKSVSRVGKLHGLQALAGSDYRSERSATVIIPDGESTAAMPLTVIADLLPELNEKFSVILNRVQLVQGPADRLINEPRLGEETSTTAIIRSNDDANGILRIYSRDPRALNGGQTVLVEEREHFSVELIVARTGGTIGDVSVVWSVDHSGSNASRETDYIADGATLSFTGGDIMRVITIGIKDDEVPEYDEVIVVQLTDPQGGALLDERNRVEVVIQANDNVAGVVGFTSSSHITSEGEEIIVEVSRTAPAAGSVSIIWRIIGVNEHVASQGFETTTGTLNFDEGEMLKVITLSVMADSIPEVKEEYQISLSNITTTGISSTGVAVVDTQRSVASITVRASNEPHGVFSFASSSLNIELTEQRSDGAFLVVDRKFGSIGSVRVHYSVRAGHLTDLNDELEEALPDQDFVSGDYSIVIDDGENFGHLPLNITDDAIPEVQEVFLVNLTGVELVDSADSTNLPMLSAGDTLSQVFIAANDGTRGLMEFPEDYRTLTVNESSISVEIPVVRAFGSYGDVSVFVYSQTSRNALLDEDYLFEAHELKFLAGENLKVVNITILNDEIPETDEVVELVLASPNGGAALGEHRVCRITIAENDGAGGIVQFDSNVSLILQETFSSDGFPTSVDIQVTRGPGLFGVVEISFMVVDSFGVETNDISPSNGTVTFSDLQETAIIGLSVNDDDIPEFTESFKITLFSDFSFLLGDVTNKDIVILASDSPNGLLSITTLGNSREINVEESMGTVVTCQIHRTGGLLGDVTITVESMPLTASASPGDNIYVAPLQTFDFVAGGYCSFGNYLLVLNVKNVNATGIADQSQLFKWDGMYKHLAYVETNNAIKCFSSQESNMSVFIIVNQGISSSQSVESRLYNIENDDTVMVLDSLRTDGVIDATYFRKSEDSCVTIATSDEDSDSPGVDLQTYVIRNDRFELVNNRLRFPSLVAFEVVNQLAVIAQEENVKVYNLIGLSWNLQQTIPVSGTVDVATGSLNGKLLLFIAVENEIRIYRRNGLAFSSISEGTAVGVQKITSFQMMNNLMLLVSNSLGTSIIHWDGLTFLLLWHSDIVMYAVPLTPPNQTSDTALLGTLGYPGSVNVVGMLSQEADYIPRVVTYTLKEFEAVKEFTIPILDDMVPEDTESFQITLTQPTGGVAIGDNNSVTVNILSNDNAHGIIEFSESSRELAAVEELSDSVIQFNLVRRGGTHGRVAISWAVSADIDISGDVSPTNGVVQFGPGQVVAQLSITLRADRVAESDEFVNITLTQILESGSTLPDRGATIGLLRSSTLVILANQSPYGVIRWARQSVLVAEPESNDITVPLSVIREQGTLGNLHITYITSRDLSSSLTSQAISGQDYVSTQQSAIMLENQTRITVEVVIKADDLPETEEQFLVNITSVRLVEDVGSDTKPSVRYAGDVIRVIIAENDNARGIIQLDADTNNEGRVDVYESDGEDTLLRIRVVRELGVFGNVTVLWQILPREANADDISMLSGSVGFTEGQNETYIELYITDDNMPEPIEMFDLQLVHVNGGAVLGTSQSVRVAILKNDSPNGMFGFVQTSYNVRESQIESERAVSIQVQRLQGYQGVVNVNWQLDAAAVLDFDPPYSGSLHFNDGQSMNSFTVTAKLDTVLEGEERFDVTLISADNNADISVTHHTSEIIVQANQGSGGHVEVVAGYRTVIVAEPNAAYGGEQAVRLTRGIGTFGEVIVMWSITPAKQTSFQQTEGQVKFLDGQRTTEVMLQTVDNPEPEERAEFLFQVTSASGGATVSFDNNKATIVFAASDFPFGLFEFESSSVIPVTEDIYQASLIVVRNLGTIGQVKVEYTTLPGTAGRNNDYLEQTSSLMFSPGQRSQSIIIRILQDDIPEGPETFFVNLTSATLISGVEGMNFTKFDSIQLDLPPIVGSLSTRSVTIEKNDGAEGVIQFDPDFTSVLVEEMVGTTALIVSRGPGTNGDVIVHFNVSSETATANEDYFLESGELSFPDGVARSSINITIVDDALQEVAEFFHVSLISVQGGAVLGPRTNSYIIIAKSDYPNGKFSFLEPLERTFTNPENSFTLELSIRRSGGLTGNQTLYWQILGPNSRLELESVSDISYVDADGMETTRGQFIWGDGESGTKSFSLNIKPFSGWEIQKTFIVKVSDVRNDVNSAENGQVDPFASNVTIIVLKNGDPNGIVQFSDRSILIEQEIIEPEEGRTEVNFYIERSGGDLGDQEVFWVVVGGDGEEDVTPSYGSTRMAEGVSQASITVSVRADDVPELTEYFQLNLVNVIGGATIRTNASTSSFSIRYNDDPHGVFEFAVDNQKITVDPATWQRSLILRVRRNAGLVGTVRATLQVDFSQQSESFPKTETIDFNNGQSRVELMVNFDDDDVFMLMESFFTASISEVTYQGGVEVTIPPKVGNNRAITINVPEIAANSIINFQSSNVQVDELTLQTILTVHRTGLYGHVQVSWIQTYPNGGVMSPPSGRVLLAHGERFANIELSLLLLSPSSADRTRFAVSLLDNPLTAAPGGARLAATNTLTEIEPSGVLRFSKREYSINEDQGSVSLSIQRDYGSRNNIRINYSTRSGSALSGVDFSLATQIQSAILNENELFVDVTIPILLDSIPEQDEVFFVMLEGVEILPTPTVETGSPRISDYYSNCTVTITSNGDPYGLLDVIVQPQAIAESDTRLVSVTVRRSAGAYRRVTVQVRTVGGGEAWDQQIALIASGPLNNTISEALSNRDLRLSATAASDYRILNEEVVFEPNEVGKRLNVLIYEDEVPESDESVFIYLTHATGGARIAEGNLDGMKYGYAFFQITRNDDWNGLIGYLDNSRNVTVDEDSGSGVTLTLTRTSHAEFTYDTNVQWEALYAIDPARLSTDLVGRNGAVTCRSLAGSCDFTVELVNDEIPEFGYSFSVRLLNSGSGSRIDPHRSIATVHVLPSDNPYGKLQFTSEYVVIGHNAEEVLIEVERKQGAHFRVSTYYQTENFNSDNAYRAGRKLYSALHGDDYNATRGSLVFPDGVVRQNIRVMLTPFNVKSQYYPKVFRVEISSPEFGVVLGSPTECRVIIVNSDELDVWQTQVEASVQEMDDTSVNYLIDTILDKNFEQLTEQTLIVLEDILTKIIEEGERRQFQDSTRRGLMSIFCKLMRVTLVPTRGRLSLIKLFERFIFTLLVGEPCDTEMNPYSSTNCNLFKVSVSKIPSTQVNGKLYISSTRNSLKLGENVLPFSKNNTCTSLQFIEYNTPHWFRTSNDMTLLDEKILAVSIKGLPRSLSPSVTYKVYTADSRRTDKRAQCVYYAEDARLWSTDNICRVKNNLLLGTSDFVECECDHLSSYAVASETRDKLYIGYPSYMFIIAGCCMFCLLVAILVHLIFPSTGLFPMKLVTHELVCSFAVLGVYLLTAFLSSESSSDPILVASDENNYKCTIIGVVLHYLILTQFSWILLQSFNIWRIFTKNDEKTSKFHCLYVLLAYGLPAVFVGAFYGITYYLYPGYNLKPDHIYGDINNEREMCFLNNQYTALAGVAAPVLVIAIGTFIFLGELSCHSKPWGSYDDIFKDRRNKGELGPLVFLWFITMLTNMVGGLHMAYNYNWMMIAFCVCLSILALFSLGYFAILRGPCSTCGRKSPNLNLSADKYQSTLVVNTDGGESMLQVPSVQYPSPHSQSQLSRSRELLAPQHTLPWDHDSEDGLLNGSMMQRSSAALDHSSLSRRSELPPEEDDARDLGELILALRESHPGTPHPQDHTTSATVSTEDDDDDDSEEESHLGSYDVLRRISIADTHL